MTAKKSIEDITNIVCQYKAKQEYSGIICLHPDIKNELVIKCSKIRNSAKCPIIKGLKGGSND